MTSRSRSLAALILIGVTCNAQAGPDGVFLCNSNAPYDFLTADTHNYRQFGIRRNGQPLSEIDTGALVAGQGVKGSSANGLTIVPNGVGEKGWIELRKQGRVLRKIPGWLGEFDTWSNGHRDKAMFVAWNGDRNAPPTLMTWQTRYVVDGDGNILLEKYYETYMDNENGDPLLLFTADGEAFYEETSEPRRIVNLYNASDLQPIGRVEAPEGQRLDQLGMLSATRGFAISSGKVYRFEHGELRPLPLQLASDAQNIQIDTRARRVLVEASVDFMVMDLAGTVLYHYASRQPAGASPPPGVDAKLAIDGSVGFMRNDDQMVTVLTRKSGYTQSRTVPLGEDDWRRVACFTPNSAALLVDDEPLLIKF
jgi:hypothetical protein